MHPPLPTSRLFSLALSVSLCSAVGAQSLVKDILPGGSSNTTTSSPSEFTLMNGKVYFAADDGNLHGDCGRELWVTDGTAAGTHIVKDCAPGFRTSGWPNSSNPHGFCVVGSTLFFAADDGEHGIELWKSDGTAEGTQMVRNIYPDSSPAQRKSSNPLHLVALGTTVLFYAGDPTYGGELWKSDGTAAGTVLVKDILPGSYGSGPSDLTVVGSTVFFTASDKSNGTNIELWKTDGTTAGTVKVKEINSTGSSYPRYLTAVGGTLYFSARDDTTGDEPWKSDGTELGTVRIGDIVSGTGGSNPSQFTRVGPTVFFVASDGTNGQELWKTNGTASSTVLVKDIATGNSSSQPGSLLAHNGKLYFGASWFAPSSARGLWVSDGTATGTVPILATNACDQLTAVGSKLFFLGTGGYDPKYRTLYVSDGTTLGTLPLRDFLLPYGARLGIAYGSLLLLDSDEPWKSDGTVAGTVQITDIYGPTPNSSAPSDFVQFGGFTYFAAEGQTGRELWRSDGTAAGTTLVWDMFPGNYSSTVPNSGDPKEMTVFKGKIVYSAVDNRGATTNNREVWATDGTVAAKLAEINPDTGFGSNPTRFTPVGNLLFFSAANTPQNTELWATDGTAAGTFQVKDIDPRYQGSGDPRDFTALGNLLLFTADDGINGRELWKSDGTASGTVMVTNIGGSTASQPMELTAYKGHVYFRAYDTTNGWEVWRSDGTAAGTSLLKDINPGSGNSGQGEFVIAGGILFFSAFQPVIGEELWMTDGTVTGTVMVKDCLPGGTTTYPSSSSPRNLTAAGKFLYFTTTLQGSGSVRYWNLLWRSDGTTAGTVLLEQFGYVDNYLQQPRELTAVGGSVYFQIASDAYGFELWKNDGTTTRIAEDTRPGPQSSSPSGMFLGAGTLFFIANDGTTGIELHGHPVEAVAAPVGIGCSAAHPLPTLAANAPRLGKSLDLEIHGRPATGGSLFLGLAAVPTPIGFGCTIYFDTSLYALLAGFQTDAAGKATLSYLVPNVPSSVGKTYVVQTILSPTTNLPWGVDFTNGLYLTIGN
ncbi:MAG: hypothetical protein H6837_08460 [Planctomycetes bacterium]|nr:hypothetical protein [Planctomycetota bacterium]